MIFHFVQCDESDKQSTLNNNNQRALITNLTDSLLVYDFSYFPRPFTSLVHISHSFFAHLKFHLHVPVLFETDQRQKPKNLQNLHRRIIDQRRLLTTQRRTMRCRRKVILIC